MGDAMSTITLLREWRNGAVVDIDVFIKNDCPL
jgi:hypothetical protein